MKALLTMEQAQAIENWLQNYAGGKEALIVAHATKGEWVEETAGLNGVSIETLAKALFIGYDIEKSPEERLKDFYHSLDPIEQQFTRTAIKKTLEILNLKVKGVNC